MSSLLTVDLSQYLNWYVHSISHVGHSIALSNQLILFVM